MLLRIHALTANIITDNAEFLNISEIRSLSLMEW
jgi:hypothetical protein